MHPRWASICHQNRSFNPSHSIRADSCLLEYTLAGNNKLEFRKEGVECSSELAGPILLTKNENSSVTSTRTKNFSVKSVLRPVKAKTSSLGVPLKCAARTSIRDGISFVHRILHGLHG